MNQHFTQFNLNITPNFSIDGQRSWIEEKNKQAERYNGIGLWIALVLYPIWSVLDYLLAPNELFYSFFYARCICALVMLLFALTYLKWKFNTDWLAFPVVLTISADIAYKTNTVNDEIITPYMIQYCTLFVCAGMLHIWSLRNSILIAVYTISTMVFFKEYSGKHTYPQLLTNGGLIILTVLIVYVFLIETRLILMKKAFMANFNLNLAHEEVKQKNVIIEKKNLQIVDSINYGKRIQNAFLPNSFELKQAIGEHFIFYRPKNVVSGDFYWFAENDKKKFFAVADCTGHGVPGAFMSIIGASLLNQLVHENHIYDSNLILENLRIKIKQLLRQESNDVRDGIEIGIIVLDNETKEVDYSGARINLWIVKNGSQIIEIEADKQAIGGFDYPNFNAYKSHKLPLEKGDVIFMTSDGYPDQFNLLNKKIGKKKTKEICIESANLFPSQAGEKIISHFDNWKGNYDQIDDILIAGIWYDNIVSRK